MGFGLASPIVPSLPRYLCDEADVHAGDVFFRGGSIPLLEDEMRLRLGRIALENHDFLLRLGTKNNISRILVACSCQNLVVREATDINWISVMADCDELLSLAAPKIHYLEGALCKAFSDRAHVEKHLAAVARYFAFDTLADEGERKSRHRR